MFDRILVPTDGSAIARNAAESAIRLATRFDATVHALYVLGLDELPPGADVDGTDALATVGERAVDEITEMASEAGVDVDAEIVESSGPVHEAIIDNASDHDSDLIVMGTHSRTGLDRLVLGSVTERTLRESDVPVLTVHEGDGIPENLALDDVLVPTDGSRSADAAVARGIDLAAETDATLHLITLVDTSKPWTAVVDEGALDGAGKEILDNAILRAEAADVDVIEGSVGRGDPETAIRDYVTDHDIDLVVMGTHGRTGLNRYLLGSVTEHVVRTAEAPVLSVRAVEDA